MNPPPEYEAWVQAHLHKSWALIACMNASPRHLAECDADLLRCMREEKAALKALERAIEVSHDLVG